MRQRWLRRQRFNESYPVRDIRCQLDEWTLRVTARGPLLDIRLSV